LSTLHLTKKMALPCRVRRGALVALSTALRGEQSVNAAAADQMGEFGHFEPLI